MFAQVMHGPNNFKEKVKLFQVPDVVVAPQQVTGGIQKVQISQVRSLPFLILELGFCKLLQNSETNHLQKRFFLATPHHMLQTMCHLR